MTNKKPRCERKGEQLSSYKENKQPESNEQGKAVEAELENPRKLNANAKTKPDINDEPSAAPVSSSLLAKGDNLQEDSRERDDIDVESDSQGAQQSTHPPSHDEQAGIKPKEPKGVLPTGDHLPSMGDLSLPDIINKPKNVESKNSHVHEDVAVRNLASDFHQASKDEPRGAKPNSNPRKEGNTIV